MSKDAVQKGEDILGIVNSVSDFMRNYTVEMLQAGAETSDIEPFLAFLKSMDYVRAKLNVSIPRNRGSRAMYENAGLITPKTFDDLIDGGRS